MFFIWEIFVKGESKGFVRTMTEHQARYQYYVKHGSASAYSGLSLHQIEAKRV